MKTFAPRSNPAIRRELISAINSFSFKLFGEVAEWRTNCFLSPFSIYSGLSMLYSGAGTTTREALAEVLALPDVEDQEFHAAFAGLWEELHQPEEISREEKWRQAFLGRKEGEGAPAYQLDMANSLWINRKHRLNADFLETAQLYYRGEAAAVNFQFPGTIQRINYWVADKTHGKISTIIDQIDPQALMLLLNAIYFKGEWTFPFDRTKTLSNDFYLADDRKKRLPMMHMSQAEELAYLKTRELEIVRLPYRRERMGMYLLLPGRASSLDTLLSHIDVFA